MLRLLEASPNPESELDAVPPGLPLATRVAERLPAPSGAKLTVTWQEAPAASGAPPQVLKPRWKSPAVGPVKDKDTLPLEVCPTFFTVKTLLVELVRLT